LGRLVKVFLSSDKSKIGISGKIIDETRNMIYIRTKEDIKKIPKKGSKFEIYIDKWEKVDGDRIIYRPEDRIKLVKKLRC